MRRKLEGKPVTKKEREAESRRLAHLAALEAKGTCLCTSALSVNFTVLLGIVVPEKSGGSKKVVYGSRMRNKKERSEPAMNSNSDYHCIINEYKNTDV